MQLMTRLAGFRPAFASASEFEDMPYPVTVSRGPATPGVICFPSFAGRSGTQEYARFAGGFRGIRDVSVMPAPGFAAQEPLPDSVGALISAHAANLRRSSAGAPFVLAGHSSGGLVAHALATHLEGAGTPPAAVVLIDTFPFDAFADLVSILPAKVLADAERRGDAEEDAWLTAMAHYFSLDWAALDRTALPTLLLRARERLDGPPADSEPKPGEPKPGEPKPGWPWSSNLTTVEVPGDHFTMMTDHAATTAAAVNDWLAAL
jgi:thioesterase domain-containing protein